MAAAGKKRLGVASAVGEIPGEYCPGRFSVHHSGGRKIMGVGQRLAANAAHVGGVVVVDGAPEVNEVLHPVYGALGVEFEPSATGALSDQIADVTVTAVVDAIIAELASVALVEPATLSSDMIAAGRALLAEGMRRMRSGGLERAMVLYGEANPASGPLYRAMGFVPTWTLLDYRKPVVPGAGK